MAVDDSEKKKGSRIKGSKDRTGAPPSNPRILKSSNPATPGPSAPETLALRPDAEHTDLIIVGSEPAAAVAAIRGRALGLSSLLLRDESAGTEARPTLREARTTGSLTWLAAPGIELCRQCGLDAHNFDMLSFDGLYLRSGDLRRRLRVAADHLCGWIVKRADFEHALRDRAVCNGATIVQGRAKAVHLGDENLTVTLSDGRALSAAILIIADGPESPTADLARMDSIARTGKIPQAFTLSLPGAADQGELNVVLGVGHGTNIGVILRLADRVHLGLLVRGGDGAPQAQFDRFRAAAEAAGLIPKAPSAKPSTFLSPAGAALDVDSHVGKRTLRIGEAGGFVAAFSNERLYAAMRSGWLAAEAAARAIAADLMQDELVTFESAWRTELADYLRMPGTDLSLLMPLVFNENLQMSERVARAFLLGDKF